MEEKLSLTTDAYKATINAAANKASITPAADKARITPAADKATINAAANKASITPAADKATINAAADKLSIKAAADKFIPTTDANYPNTSVMTSSRLSRARDFDDVLEVVGSFGRYQKRMMFLIFAPVNFFAGFTSTLFLFQMAEPDHWCRTPGRENTSLNEAEWRNLTHPKSSDTGELSQCLRHDIQWTSHNNITTFIVTNQTQECNDGWEFDKTQFTATVATTLAWVCERGHYSHHTLSIHMAGNAVGTLVLPILADKYFGRRLMFYVALVIHLVFSIPLLWVTDTTWHKALRFLHGLSHETSSLMPYVTFMEIIPPERRALSVMVSFVSWSLGMCFTALVAWLLPHWQYLIIVSLFPSLLCFLYWRLFQDSPRWLLAKGRVQQCVNILLQIGTTNGAEGVSRVGLETQLKVLMRRQPVDQPLTTVLAYPRLTMRALMLFLMSFMQFVVYSVAMLSMTVLSNSFLAHFVLSIFPLPSNFIGCAVTHYLGRRFMAYSTFLLLSGFCIAGYFCIENEWLLLTILGFVKLFSTCGLFVVFLMASEVLPTPVRNSGTGVTVVFGMLGMVAAPHVLHVGLGEGGYFWILLAMTLASALCMIPMQETLGLTLPQTFQDADDLGRDRPFTTWIHHWNLHKHLKPTKPQQDTSEHLIQNPI